MCNFIWERPVDMFSVKEHAKMLQGVYGRADTSGSEDIFCISNFWYQEKIARTSQRWIIYVKKGEYTCSSFVIFRGTQSLIQPGTCAFCQFVIVPLLSFIHSFIPLACVECDDSLPFWEASSIPLCCLFFPVTLLHQLFIHPPSILPSISWSTSQSCCSQIHI